MESKIKHLEFIQNVITRMNSNSFLIKGWTITIVSALFALAAREANPHFVMIAYIPIPMFWFLDGFYIFQEKQYRDLYNDVISKTNEAIDFNMNASGYKNTWLGGIFSKTIWPFYVLSICITLVVMYFISR